LELDDDVCARRAAPRRVLSERTFSHFIVVRKHYLSEFCCASVVGYIQSFSVAISRLYGTVCLLVRTELFVTYNAISAALLHDTQAGHVTQLFTCRDLFSKYVTNAVMYDDATRPMKNVAAPGSHHRKAPNEKGGCSTLEHFPDFLQEAQLSPRDSTTRSVSRKLAK